MYRRGTRACFYSLDFQSKNFSYAIFIIKKWPLYVNFSILQHRIKKSCTWGYKHALVILGLKLDKF
jgi:hypothetical protein